MAIVKKLSIVLILNISYSLGLDLFGISKIDTQETSLNIASVSFLLTFDKFPPNYYLISQILYLSIMFFLVHLRNSKGYEIVAPYGGQFLSNIVPQRGPSTLERAYFNGTVKHFLSQVT